jgi:putative oxidoreductase
MDVIFLIGRILFSSIFIMSGAMSHLMNLEGSTQYAEMKGVPSPRISVIVSGIVILLAGIAVLIGWQVQIASILLLLFLLSAMFFMHDFWALDDPQQQQAEMSQFMKNLVIAGGCLILFWLYSQPEVPPFSLGG